VLASCNANEFSVGDYLRYFKQNDNSYKINYTKNFKIRAEYKSNQFMALISSMPEGKLDIKAFEEHKEKNKDQVFFFVKFFAADSTAEALKYNINSEKEYYGRIEYLSTIIKNDFHLITDYDTILCAMHVYERAFSITPYEQIILVFDAKRPFENGELIYNGIFSENEDVRFVFSKKIMKNIPKLRI
jgi:hypothetical protein